MQHAYMQYICVQHFNYSCTTECLSPPSYLCPVLSGFFFHNNDLYIIPYLKHYQMTRVYATNVIYTSSSLHCYITLIVLYEIIAGLRPHHHYSLMSSENAKMSTIASKQLLCFSFYIVLFWSSFTILDVCLVRA